MLQRMRSARLALALALMMVVCLPVASQGAKEKQGPQPVVGTAAENPVAFTMSSIKRGKRLYASHCVLCHGKDGRGDTQMREFLKTYPANLVDQQWIYGDRDGDIFEVIKNGKPDRDMEAFGTRLSDERIWQIVHYLRYMGGKRPE